MATVKGGGEHPNESSYFINFRNSKQNIPKSWQKLFVTWKRDWLPPTHLAFPTNKNNEVFYMLELGHILVTKNKSTQHQSNTLAPMRTTYIIFYSLYPPPSISGKWRFIGVPYYKCSSPGGDCYWAGGRSNVYIKSQPPKLIIYLLTVGVALVVNVVYTPDPLSVCVYTYITYTLCIQPNIKSKSYTFKYIILYYTQWLYQIKLYYTPSY